jgi:hypothetical protein
LDLAITVMNIEPDPPRVEGASVRLDWTAPGGSPAFTAAISNASGVATLVGIDAGGSNYKLTVSKSGWSGFSVQMEILEGQLWPTAVFIVNTSVAFSLRVLDQSGAAVAGATVRIVNGSNDVSFTTNASGYVSPTLPSGDYQIQISAPGRATFWVNSRLTQTGMYPRLFYMQGG